MSGPELKAARIVIGFYWVREPADDHWVVAYVTQTHDEPYTIHFVDSEEEHTQPGFIIGPRLIPPPLDAKSPVRV